MTLRSSRFSLVFTTLLAFATFALAGCAHVPPYDRGLLAHPTMVADDLAGPSEAHVRAIHEGATGGGAAAEGGCGCN